MSSTADDVVSPRELSLRRAFREPRAAFRFARAVTKGRFYQWFLPLIGRRFKAGRNFRIYGKLVVRGAGRVVFGDNVAIYRRVTPFTHHPDALITVGDGTRMSGTRFGCALRIDIGRQCLLASCHIMDTDFHPVGLHARRDPNAQARRAAVKIGDGVWLGEDSVVLPGTTIGDNSVTSVMSVCAGNYPANVVIAGNPGRAARKVPGARSPSPSEGSPKPPDQPLIF